MGNELTDIDHMRERITDEIFFALGFKRDGALRQLFGRLFYQPTQTFAKIFATADEAVGQAGLPAGSRVILERLGVAVQAAGADNIPPKGPLLVVSNHPGAYDSISLASMMPRPDMKIIVFETQLYRAMPNTHRCFIFASEDTVGRMVTLRNAVQHLQERGAILQFGTGKIEPDPEVAQGAETWIGKWSHSLEIMLRKAPQTQVVLAIASGVVLPRFANHPLTWMRRGEINKRRLAEFLQVIQHLVRPNSVKVHVKLSFSPPCSVPDLEGSFETRRLMPQILTCAQAHLSRHMQYFYSPQAKTA